MAARSMNPSGLGTLVISSLRTWSDRSTATSRSRVTGRPPYRPVGVERVSDLAGSEEDGRPASGMRPLDVPRPSCEGGYIDEWRLHAGVAASPALPGAVPAPDQPWHTVRRQAD